MRPLVDLLGAQPGDVLQLQYQGRQGSVVQVAASLVSRRAASRGTAPPSGDILSQMEQLGAAEAAAELLGLRRSEAEPPPPASQVSGQQGAALPAPGAQADAAATANRERGKRGHSDEDGGKSSHREADCGAQRRTSERGGSSAGLQSPSPAAGLFPAEDQPLTVAGGLQARTGAAGSQQVEVGQLSMQPAPPQASADSKGAGGSAKTDAIRQAAAVLAAAQEAEDRRRPIEQMRAVLRTLGLMGVEPLLSAVGCGAGRVCVLCRAGSGLFVCTRSAYLQGACSCRPERWPGPER